MSNIVKLKVVEKPEAKQKADASLKRAKGKLSECVIVGMAHDGSLYATSTESPADTLFLIEFAKRWMLDGCPGNVETIK